MILYKILLTFLLLFNIAAAKADPVIGLDHLALLSPSYPEDQVLSALDRYPALGFLWRSFGTDLSRVERLLGTGKVKVLRIHLLNGPGLRNKQLAAYEFLAGMSLQEFRRAVSSKDLGVLKLIEDESRNICEYLAKKYPHVIVYCSPILEHNLSAEEFQTVAQAAAKGSPSSTIVNSPMELIENNPSNAYELHGYPKAASDIVSLDGSTPSVGETPSSFTKRYPESKIVFWWQQSMNCRSAGKFIAPRERTNCWSGN